MIAVYSAKLITYFAPYFSIKTQNQKEERQQSIQICFVLKVDHSIKCVKLKIFFNFNSRNGLCMKLHLKIVSNSKIIPIKKN